MVSTHSRPKAAGRGLDGPNSPVVVSTHSRPKAAAEILAFFVYSPKFQHTAARRRLAAQTAIGGHAASFNTQPPEGGCVIFRDINAKADVSTHSRPKAAEIIETIAKKHKYVSTHSRPKAAGPTDPILATKKPRFNTQPPEGGCPNIRRLTLLPPCVSTHSRPKAAVKLSHKLFFMILFQHTAARRRLASWAKLHRQPHSFNTQPPEGG